MVTVSAILSISADFGITVSLEPPPVLNWVPGILLTNDKDFGELVFLQGKVAEIVRRLGRRLSGRFTVAGDRRVRSRKLK